MPRFFVEPDRDPRLADALRRIDETSVSDDHLLRQRIMDAARPMLAALRTAGRPWWSWLSAWVRVVVPVSVAASLAAALFLPGRSDVLTGVTTGAGTVAVDSTIVLAAYSEPGTGGQLTAHLIAPETGDWLLAQAFDQ